MCNGSVTHFACVCANTSFHTRTCRTLLFAAFQPSNLVRRFPSQQALEIKLRETRSSRHDSQSIQTGAARSSVAKRVIYAASGCLWFRTSFASSTATTITATLWRRGLRMICVRKNCHSSSPCKNAIAATFACSSREKALGQNQRLRLAWCLTLFCRISNGCAHSRNTPRLYIRYVSHAAFRDNPPFQR